MAYGRTKTPEEIVEDEKRKAAEAAEKERKVGYYIFRRAG